MPLLISALPFWSCECLPSWVNYVKKLSYLTYHYCHCCYYYHYYCCYFGITSPLCGEKNAYASGSYPLSEMPKTLLRIKAVPSNAAFCKQAPKVRTLTITIYRYRNFELAITIAKNRSEHFSENTKMRIIFFWKQILKKTKTDFKN